MGICKRNPEGYSDPTAYAALTRIADEEKQKAFKPLVFICSPYSGDTEGNARNARLYCRFAIKKNFIPLAPHLLFPQFLDDGDPAERELGLFCGMVLLCRCSELWVFGDDITTGMAAEIAKAKRRGMHIRYFDEDCREVQRI